MYLKNNTYEKPIDIMFIIIISMSCSLITLHAEEESSNQDDEEHGYEITNWLFLAATVEFEQGQERQTASDRTKTKNNEFSKSLDVELLFKASVNLRSEIALEFDDENGHFLIDEAIVILELDKTEIELGKTTLPFGEYSSKFINDSPINFAERKTKGVIITHDLKDDTELSFFAYKNDTTKFHTSHNAITWGLTSSFTPSESLNFGIGYTSDLNDSEGIEVDADNNTEKRVDGISAFSLHKFSDFEFSTELTSALDDFQELEKDRNRPIAWNLELAHKLSNNFDWALRFAGSRELKDEPFRQYGISGSWQINKKMTLSLEYLENNFINDLAENIQERPLKKSKEIAAQLSISF